VRDLLGAYRDVVLKYEALSLVLQQQLCGTEAQTVEGMPWTGSTPSMQHHGAGVSAAAGAFLNKLATWTTRASSGHAIPPGVHTSLEGDAQAVPGGGKGGDPGLLHTLFGHSQPRTKPTKKWISDDVGGDVTRAPNKADGMVCETAGRGISGQAPMEPVATEGREGDAQLRATEMETPA